MCMCAQPKNMTTRLAQAALPVLASLTLLGCTSSAQSRRDVPHWDWHAQLPTQSESQMTHSGNSDAVIFAPGVETTGSWYAYERDLAPEYARRDAELAVGEPDPTAGWYAWPEQQRPSLDDQRSFNTSRNPGRYVYPSVDDGRRGYSGRTNRFYQRRHVR